MGYQHVVVTANVDPPTNAIAMWAGLESNAANLSALQMRWLRGWACVIMSATRASVSTQISVAATVHMEKTVGLTSVVLPRRMASPVLVTVPAVLRATALVTKAGTVPIATHLPVIGIKSWEKLAPQLLSL